jgi:hypothetical protein
MSQTQSVADGRTVIATPIWCTVMRGFQIFFAFVIMILAGLLIHGYAMDANVFGLVCGLFTFVVAIYALVTEKAPTAHSAYNVWAILSLDLFMAILWLASMGANAALRSTFTVNVNADCYNDGSAVNSGHCVVSRAELNKRYAVVSKAGLAYISGIAGLSALEMLLFLGPLIFIGHTFRMQHQGQSQTVSSTTTNLEMGKQQTPMLNPNHPSSAPQQPQYHETQEYKPQYDQTQHPVHQAPGTVPSPAPLAQDYHHQQFQQQTGYQGAVPPQQYQQGAPQQQQYPYAPNSQPYGHPGA